ncbi:MAG: hypothetical protein NE330_08170 [Lentisphaeraceae bacterium]|nr:hypothetical protein [Lentisphaeraceae bacterium]
MKFTLYILIISLFSTALHADKSNTKPQEKVHLLKAFSLNTPELSNKFSKDLKVGGDLRTAIIQNQLILKDKSKSKDHTSARDNLAKLKKSKGEYDKKMNEVYGLVPDLSYIAIAEQGTVYLLLSENELDAINSPTDKNGTNEDKVKYSKFPAFKLNTSQAIISFNKNLNIGNQLKYQKSQLLEKIKAKSTKELKQQLQKVEQSIEKYDAGMKQTYGIRPNLKYIFEPTASAVYISISDAHLTRVAQLQEAERNSKLKAK